MKLGCNYWASHAGLKMWKNWDPKTINDDLDLLSEWKIKVIRVFPIWPEFHKLEPVYGGKGKLLEISGGVSKKEIDKLIFLINAARERDIEVIVSLINGWMSGCLFIPELFYNRNVLTDPEAIRYQIIYIRELVESLKHSENVIGWDLGNECNVMGEVENHNQAWLWMNSIYNAIKEKDSKRTVYAGMHGLDMEGKWRIRDVAENCDVLTTHPYPLFTPYCGRDPLDEGRSIYHPTAETQYYADIAKKPCIIEEMGSLGPDIASEKHTAAYLEKVIGLALDSDIPLILWWCAFDQPFEFLPYGNIALERELGIFTKDRQPKEIAYIFKNFSNKINPAEIRKKAVCVLTEGQDNWKTAYGTYIISQEVCGCVEFSWHRDELPDYDIYMLPCITGYNVINRKNWMNLIERVKHGASLYISYNGGFITEFGEVTGVCIDNRREIEERIVLESGNEFHCDTKLVITAESCVVLLRDANGIPFLTKNKLGAGIVYFCRAPVEMNCIDSVEYKPEIYSEIYKYFLFCEEVDS